MNDRSQIFIHELINDGALQAESRMLEAMLKAVQKKKNTRAAVGLSSVATVAALGLWIVQSVNQVPSPVKYIDQPDIPAIAEITGSSQNIEYIQTSDNYVRYMTEDDTTIRLIDDNELVRIIQDHSYAIVGNVNLDGGIYLLLDTIAD